MNLTVKYGIDEIKKATPGDSITVADALADYEIKAALGYGDNVRALINGVEQPMHALIPDGATLRIETRSNTKAVLEPRPGLIEA